MTEQRKIASKSLLLPILLALLTLSACATASGYRINHFQEGKVVVDNKVYRYGVLIMPDGSVRRTPGSESHMVYLKDIEEFIGAPEITTLVVGAGTENKVELDRDLLDRLGERGIEVKRMSTEDAVRMLNGSPKQGLVTILHVGC